MDKIKKLFCVRKKGLSLLVFMITIMLLITACMSTNLYDRILDFCKNHDEINLSEITDFDWDIAYIDRDYYHSGEELEKKHQIEGTFKMLHSDYNYRIAFCKDNVLVYDLILVDSTIETDNSIEIIYPDSIFTVTRVPIPEIKEEKLILTLKNNPQEAE